MSVGDIIDNTKEVLAALDRQKKAALEAIGHQATSHARSNITEAGRVDTGALRNSITHKVVGDAVYIGTNLSYAPFHELGTGIHIAGGRNTPWSYQDHKGNWHRTSGVEPIHFLKNAASQHSDEYAQIMEKYLKGG